MNPLERVDFFCQSKFDDYKNRLFLMGIILFKIIYYVNK